jgi:hypothetical protein
LNGNDVTFNDSMTFDKFDSSSKAHRAVTSTARSRECRKRKKLGLMVRKVRINSGTVKKLVALGYLERGGDEKAEGMAIEAYLGDTL